jgi:hypothetical protein
MSSAIDPPPAADPLDAAYAAAWRTAEDVGVIVGDGHTVRINRVGIAATVRAAALIIRRPLEARPGVAGPHERRLVTHSPRSRGHQT